VPERHLTRAKILSALQALGHDLANQGVRGQIFIVGGAAMALAYSTRRVTKDIDAVFEPKVVIYEAAARIAAELGLPDDWLNGAAKAFMSGPDEAACPLPEVDGIEITTALPQYLLALKLMAMRFGEDDEDIEILLRQSGLHTAQEALDVVQRMYPHSEAPAETRFFLEELLGPASPRRSSEEANHRR
jgi:hypothetical protein